MWQIHLLRRCVRLIVPSPAKARIWAAPILAFHGHYCGCSQCLYPRPKAISKVRQKRLASREQLRCLGHILSLLDLKLKKPVDALRPVSLNEHEQRMLEDGVPFLWNSVTGASEWDLCGPESVDGSLRVVLQPDEGSPMYCCYRFLASRGFKINLIRDEL